MAAALASIRAINNMNRSLRTMGLIMGQAAVAASRVATPKDIL